MPWWTWIVLWIVLLALSAVFLLVLGYRVFRKMVAALKEFERAGELLHASGAEYVADAAGTPASSAAIFNQPAAVRAERNAGKRAREHVRRERRIRLRAHREQPQLLRDLPHL